jgi:hypothetical protein
VRELERPRKLAKEDERDRLLALGLDGRGMPRGLTFCALSAAVYDAEMGESNVNPMILQKVVQKRVRRFVELFVRGVGKCRSSRKPVQ